MYQYKRTQTDLQSLKQYAKLLSDVFTNTDKFSEEFLQWQYKDNPNGEVIGIDAYLEDELAGHYVCIPVKYKFYGEERKGLLSLNTAISINHRGKGLFTKLANKTYELAIQEKFDFIIGVANQNSTHGFLKKLEFELVGPLDVFVGLGKVDIQRPSKVNSIWNEKTINWRINNPANRLKQSGAYIFSQTGMPLVNILMSKQKQSISSSGGSFGATLWMGKASEIKKKGLFMRLPDRLKPSPLNLIFRSLNTDFKYNTDDITFECIDFDAY